MPQALPNPPPTQAHSSQRILHGQPTTLNATMNPARLLSAALILLAAGTSAHAQVPRRTSNEAPAPEPLSAAILSTNYRLTLAAKSGDKALGEISVLTCSKNIEASGMLDLPADIEHPSTLLSIRGTLTEQEGGALMLAYSFGVNTPLVSQSMSTFGGSAAKRPEADAKPGDAKAAAEPKPEMRGNVSSSITYKDHNTSGSVRVKAGSTYELVTMAGVVYSLTISPEPQK